MKEKNDFEGFFGVEDLTLNHPFFMDEEEETKVLDDGSQNTKFCTIFQLTDCVMGNKL
jgi:hypothetical protein